MEAVLKKRIFDIKVSEYLLVFLFFLFSAIIYRITIWINKLSSNPSTEELFDFTCFMDAAGLEYSIKLVLTIPIWWLIFRKAREVKLKYRLMIHLITLPLFVYLGQQLHYKISEAVGFWHLVSYGKVWDIYIPTLFYLLMFSIFHAYDYYHTNQRNLKQKAALSEAALKSELAALKAQLNPHFLYNVFNTISASVPQELEQTREMIAKLSDLFRYQLKATKTELVPLGEELDFVEKYLDLEKARFEDRLQIQIDVSEEIRGAMVPPMILQPLVENSVKHGISSLVEGGAISIRIYRNDEQIQFEVSDTGVGVKDKTKLFNVGVGLTNTKLRLEKMYGSKMKFSDNQPQGLKIEFAIG